MPVSPTDPIIANAARNTGLPPSVVAAQVNVESEGNPNAVSPAGAEGEFQFLPSTYTGLGFPAGTEFDPAVEVRAYEKYMTELLAWARGDVRQALAAYNAGQGNWQAGLGYADTILSNAKAGTGLTVGTSQQSTTTSGGGILGDIGTAVTGFLGAILPGSTQLGKLIAGLGPGGGIGALIAELIQVIDWGLHPSNWVRVFCGLAGGVLVLAGIWQMTHAGEGAL